MPETRLPLRIGGVMRCCVQVLNEHGPSASNSAEGDTLTCPYCGGGLIVRDGAWEWWRDKPKDEAAGRLTLHRTLSERTEADG